jgi:hypothetical protein
MLKFSRLLANSSDNALYAYGRHLLFLTNKHVSRCQRGFLKDIQLGRNIARNTALSENVFMMAVCTELRIPLFVVGKPGSSKSLAKDVISTNMKAGNSQSELFKNLKQVRK